MTETAQLQPGRRFAGKYQIERFLGSGGMSTVYEATNLALRSRVALKVMTDELTCVPAAVERFVREGVAASRVRHRAVVQVYDAGEHEGTPWIAMEHIEGESLADRFKARGALPPEEVLRIAREVAEGLAAAHDQGVIHRDLKPHNVVLDCSQDPPQPKILDFGIAKLGDLGKAKLTQAGMLMGTPHYMSPEQARGESDVGAAADLWALGVIMFEGLSGQMPYEAESVALYLGKLVTAEPRDLRALATTAPEPVVRIVEWCLKPDPGDRPRSARELVAEIDLAQRALAGDAAVAGRPGPAAGGAASRRRPITLGRRGVVALAAAALGLNATCLAAIGVGAGRLACDDGAAGVAAQPDQLGPAGQAGTSPGGQGAPAALGPTTVLVDSDPRGARILLNGRDLGVRTPTAVSLAPPAHVEVRLEGYAPASEVVGPEATSLFFDLERARRRGKGHGKGHGKASGFERWEQEWRREKGRADERDEPEDEER
jgi:hypothetical protein